MTFLVMSALGGSDVISGASGGKVWAFNNITNIALVAVLAINPSRQSITFHNPGTSDIFVAPAITASGAALAPSNAALGGAFRVYANGGTLFVSGECQGAWNAFASAGTTNPLTVMESNL